MGDLTTDYNGERVLSGSLQAVKLPISNLAANTPLRARKASHIKEIGTPMKSSVANSGYCRALGSVGMETRATLKQTLGFRRPARLVRACGR
jgi:hypothetical protein